MKPWIVLCAIVLILSACKTLKDPPSYSLCGIHKDHCHLRLPSGDCIRGPDKKCKVLPLTDPSLQGGQILTAQDYNAVMDYVDYLIDEAERRCK